MTPEQLDKAIQFLIEQQAALDAAFHRDREAAKQDRDQTEARFRDVAKKQEETLALVQANSEQIQSLSKQIQTLKDACRDLLEHANYTDFPLNRLEDPKNR